MTTFVARDVSHLGVDRVATSTTAFALYQNLFAFSEKASGSPVLANDYVVTSMITNLAVTTAKINDLAVTEGKLGNSAVAQAKLKTTTGEVSTASSALLTLPGGEYGFYAQVKNPGGTGQQNAAFLINDNPGTGYVTSIHLDTNGSEIFAQQRYIQASPPYDLGDGDVPLFVFALVDGLGKVLATYVAPDPPWANNGPTDIRADLVDQSGRTFKLARPALSTAKLQDPALRDDELAKLDAAPQLIEITQAVKQADMPLIPHPFQGNDLTGISIVLLDPVSALIEKLLRLHEAGESVSALLHGEYLRLDNKPVARAMPPGVIALPVSWKLTP